MAKQTTSMTTGEFAKAAGIPAATVSKLVREGKLRAKKEGRGWMIPQSQLEAKIVRDLKKTPKPSKVKKLSKPPLAPKSPKAPTSVVSPAPQTLTPPTQAASAPVADRPPAPSAESAPKPDPELKLEDRTVEKAYTIREFAAMTYLTEKGVIEWLKIRRLRGEQKQTGEWVVYASNLQVPDISRLVRK